ncbi:MAG TPA: hypothetical protein VN887_13955 [Candidatus Angelobacter sp.]|nr:hypothetical protein [Candidatus Angelobacter sp.]
MNKTAGSKNAIYKPGANYKETTPGNRAKKRDNIFSRSRDTRDDRGARQMKTTHYSQTFPHAG